MFCFNPSKFFAVSAIAMSGCEASVLRGPTTAGLNTIKAILPSGQTLTTFPRGQTVIASPTVRISNAPFTPMYTPGHSGPQLTRQLDPVYVPSPVTVSHPATIPPLPSGVNYIRRLGSVVPSKVPVVATPSPTREDIPPQAKAPAAQAGSEAATQCEQPKVRKPRKNRSSSEKKQIKMEEERLCRRFGYENIEELKKDKSLIISTIAKNEYYDMIARRAKKRSSGCCFFDWLSQSGNGGPGPCGIGVC